MWMVFLVKDRGSLPSKVLLLELRREFLLLGLLARDLTDRVVVAVDDEVVLVDHMEVVSLHPADSEAVAPDITVDGVGAFLTGCHRNRRDWI